MAIRMSGLVSGLDTEAIVGALMSAQSLKKTKIEQKKTKLEWTQTKWADLNTKLKKLYSEQVSKLQLSTAYKTKKATVSDSGVASVTAGSKAANGSYTMEVESVAKTQYLTGAKLTKDGSAITSTSTKLSQIDGVNSLVGKIIEVSDGSKDTQIEITENMTIKDFTEALKDAGLNANFDTDQSRFFISSKNSGTENAFSIKSLSSGEINQQSALKDAIGYSLMSYDEKSKVDEAIQALRSSGTSGDDYDKALETISQASYDAKSRAASQAAATYQKAKLFAENYDAKLAEVKANNTELKANYYDKDGNVTSDLDTKYREQWNKLSKETQDKYTGGVDAYVSEKVAEDYEKAAEKQAVNDTVTYVAEQIESDDNKTEIARLASTGMTKDDMIAGLGITGGSDSLKDAQTRALKQYYGTSSTDDATEVLEAFDAKPADLATIKEALGADGTKNGTKGAVYAYAAIDPADREANKSSLGELGLMDVGRTASDTTAANGATLMAARDSKIKLNGAELTSSSTSLVANGLTINLTSTTKAGESVTFSVATDVDAIYNTIKSALKEYNSVMKEMYDMYNADSAKGYNPLTSEQKEAMTDDEVKLWEDKIKGSLLRNDTTLNGIMSSMRNAMQQQVEYNGQKYSLGSFGIMTSTDYLEGGQLHIYGDSEDSVYSDRDDKLKKALQDDPDAVVSVMSGIFGNLRTVMSEKMAKTKNSSSQTFYNDVKIKNDLSDYEDQIDDWEDRLQDLEDSYYKKFSAMETAMAKLQSQQNSLGNLFGTNS